MNTKLKNQLILLSTSLATLLISHSAGALVLDSAYKNNDTFNKIYLRVVTRAIRDKFGNPTNRGYGLIYDTRDAPTASVYRIEENKAQVQLWSKLYVSAKDHILTNNVDQKHSYEASILNNGRTIMRLTPTDPYGLANGAVPKPEVMYEDRNCFQWKSLPKMGETFTYKTQKGKRPERYGNQIKDGTHLSGEFELVRGTLTQGEFSITQPVPGIGVINPIHGNSESSSGSDLIQEVPAFMIVVRRWDEERDWVIFVPIDEKIRAHAQYPIVTVSSSATTPQSHQ